MREGAGLADRSEDSNYEQLKGAALAEGASLFGVAATDAEGSRFLDLSDAAVGGLDRAVCFGFHLSDAVLADVEDGPTRLYFFHYQRVNLLLDAASLRLTALIQDSGHRALPIPASQVIDWDRQRAHLSHKHVAVAAGLGWIGRNNLLVTPQFGAHVRLATVLTDMPLRADGALDRDCDSCRACIEACPSGSIKERQSDFDHIGCYDEIRRMVKARNIGQNVCGLCVKACRGTG